MTRWKHVSLILLVLGTIVGWLFITRVAHASFISSLSIPTPTPTSSSQPSKPLLSSLLSLLTNPTVFGAIIGAIIAVIGVFYAARKQAKTNADIIGKDRKIEAQDLEIKQLKTGKDEAEKKSCEFQVERDNLIARYQGSSPSPLDMEIYEQSMLQYRENVRKDTNLIDTSFKYISIKTAEIYTQIKVLEGPERAERVNMTKILEETGISHNLDILLAAQSQQLSANHTAPADWPNIFSRGRHLLIIGGPKSGKTALLKYTALNPPHNQDILPFYIDIAKYIQSPYFYATINDTINSLMDAELLPGLPASVKGFLGFVADQEKEKFGGLNLNEVCKLIHTKAEKDEQVIFLLDNLHLITRYDDTSEDTSKLSYAQKTTDKASSGEEMIATIKNITLIINKLAEWYPKAYLLIAQRTAGFVSMSEHDILHFSVSSSLEILDLDLKNAEAFIDNMPKASLSPSIANQVKVRLRHDLRLQNLATNRLFLTNLLTLAISMSKIDGYNRYTLYKELLQDLLPGDNVNLTKRAFLQKLAWYLHGSGQAYFSRDDLAFPDNIMYSVIDAKNGNSRMTFDNKDVTMLLEELVIQHGLLRQFSGNLYCFAYPCFQEFCAAEYVMYNPTMLDTLLKHSSEDWWLEVLLLYAEARHMSVEGLFTLAHQHYETVPLLASHCFRLVIDHYYTQQISPIPNGTIANLCETMIKTRYVLHYEQLIHAIKNISMDWSNDDVRQRIQHCCDSAHADTPAPKETVETLFQALGTPQKRLITLSLLPIFADMPDEAAHTTIMDYLKDDDLPTLVQNLVTLLSNTSIESTIRLHIAHIMGWQSEYIHDTTIPDALFGSLTQITDSDLCWSIIIALGNIAATMPITDPVHVHIKQKLGEIAASSTTPHIYGATIYALARLGDDPKQVSNLIMTLLDKEAELDASLKQTLHDAIHDEDTTAIATAVLQLLQIKPHLPLLLRKRLIYLLGQACYDPATIRGLREFDPRSNTEIADCLYSAIWSIDQRIRG